MITSRPRTQTPQPTQNARTLRYAAPAPLRPALQRHVVVGKRSIRTDETMDVIAVGPGMLFFRRDETMDIRTDQKMDVIMVGPWVLSSQYGLDHGHHHCWAMDALFSERIRPWMTSWLGYGCFLHRTDKTMDVIIVGHGCSPFRTD